MSYRASLSIITVIPVRSSKAFARKVTLYGSTAALAIRGQAHTAKPGFDFVPEPVLPRASRSGTLSTVLSENCTRLAELRDSAPPKKHHSQSLLSGRLCMDIPRHANTFGGKNMLSLLH